MTDDTALDGFADCAARSAAHQPIVDRVGALVGPVAGVAIDLGCGSGALLERLSGCCPGLRPLGIEFDPARAAVANERLVPLGGEVVVADLFDVQAWSTGPALLALLMPGRLIEGGDTLATELLESLRAKVQYIVAYAYGDWLSRYGDLDGLAAGAGLRLEPPALDEATGYPRWRSCALVSPP